jgi:subfamily B ATP-binding cassette protein MsbA
MSSRTKEKLSRETLLRLLPYIRPYRARLGAGIIFGILYGATSFGIIVALRLALGGISGEGFSAGNISQMMIPEEGTTGEIPLSRIILTVSILPVIAVVQGLVYFGGKYYVEWVGNRVVADLREKMFSHIHSLPMYFFTKNRIGDLITRITSDTGMLTGLVSNVLADAIRSPFTLVGSIGAMFYLSWQLSTMALVVFPLTILPLALLGRRIRKAAKRSQENLGDMLSVTQESITGAIVVKAFQTEEEEIGRFKNFNNQVFKQTMRLTRSLAMGDPFVVGISTVGLSAVVVYAYLNNLSLALLITFAGALAQMYKPAKKLSQLHLNISRALPGAERIFEILDITNAIQDSSDSVEFNETVKTIEFKDVSFAYDEKQVLNNVNLTTEAGQCIALVGSSGAGKTTLVNLIPRFYDATGGVIELNGKNTRDYTLHSLRKRIGIVTQQTILFNRSVGENIAYGSPNASHEEIETAAKRANAHRFITELEDGYDTVIGERGSLLSGGMAQRLAIARALLRNPPILILDEATSALDNESERLVQGALNELMKDRTVFVIAHRLSTIRHADIIIVMDKGRIVERGSHEELLKQNGQYKYFYDMQFSSQKEEPNEP